MSLQDQPIAGAAHGHQVAGPGRIGLDLAPQLGDMNVDGPGFDAQGPAVAPDFG
jgi:hypothetical protein